MASYTAHVYRNLNYMRALDYIPTYAQLQHKPFKVGVGPFVWTRLLAVFDLFHSPTQTVKYMAIDPLNLHSTFEILVDHKRQEVTLGSYNYFDFRIHLLFHILFDVVTFLLWGRVLFEHATVDQVRQRMLGARDGARDGAAADEKCLPNMGGFTTILDTPCQKLLRGRH